MATYLMYEEKRMLHVANRILISLFKTVENDSGYQVLDYKDSLENWASITLALGP